MCRVSATSSPHPLAALTAVTALAILMALTGCSSLWRTDAPPADPTWKYQGWPNPDPQFCPATTLPEPRSSTWTWMISKLSTCCSPAVLHEEVLERKFRTGRNPRSI
jgi:hypothetical protein